MTMKIKITNEDKSRSARIQQRSRGADGEMKSEATATTIAPGETGEAWLHNGRDVQIEEVQ